ncbi:hypothetical protein [Bifidobacterium callitrichos]|uniref:Uncharacterized protein n=1 Tax=Bifidobacterium callitrichos DSM 23973 TaxID=1437609 RepID=A0A087A910_9BIFI|nr:hypothetical protein [Bifidobacterium callitrichos]KFI55260.1 hypothetical protein BCAL_1276 [Bifidobacterium callitrichos DSM 23973]
MTTNASRPDAGRDPLALADTRDVKAMFIGDVQQQRRDARRLAGSLLRAAAHAITAGADTFTFHVPADPLAASVQAASMLQLAQQLSPITRNADPKWDRPDPRHTQNNRKD